MGRVAERAEGKWVVGPPLGHEPGAVGDGGAHESAIVGQASVVVVRSTVIAITQILYLKTDLLRLRSSLRYSAQTSVGLLREFGFEVELVKGR